MSGLSWEEPLNRSAVWKACKLRPQEGNILAFSLADRRGWLGPGSHQLPSFRWWETPLNCQSAGRSTRLPSRRMMALATKEPVLAKDGNFWGFFLCVCRIELMSCNVGLVWSGILLNDTNSSFSNSTPVSTVGVNRLSYKMRPYVHGVPTSPSRVCELWDHTWHP